MLDKDIAHTFTTSIKRKFMELGFPSSTSGHLSKIISPFKIDAVNKTIHSRCENFFYLEQIINPYRDEIHNIVKQCWGDSFVFEIDNKLNFPLVTDKVIPSTPNMPTQTQSDEIVKKNPVSVAVHNSTSKFAIQFPFTFEAFVPCKSNINALKACHYLLKQNLEQHIPLCIYGSTGTGKTHLLQASGNAFLQSNPKLNVMYLSVHEFINEVIHQGIRQGKIEEIRNRYKFCDLLLVDDLDVLEKKNSCQIEFFQIISHVIQNKKQIIITANKPPKDILNISSRIIGRVSQGVLVELKKPLINDRIKILQNVSKERNLNISTAQIELIASALSPNIREIFGVLNDFEFQKTFSITQKEQGEQIAQIISNRGQSFENTKTTTIDHLQKTICSYFNITLSDIKSKKRSHNISLARHVAIYIAKEILKFKSSEIAYEFERKHQKIISYSIKKITKLLEHSIEIQAHLNSIQKKLL